MKIMMVLPEFEEGGVERHVLWLSGNLADLGHSVVVVSAGGKMEEKLHPSVRVLHLPVNRKNPVSGLYSALRIVVTSKRWKIDLIHAHSRVPAWIAWWASALSGTPWVVTVHARYRRNWAIAPIRRAHGAICVSRAVQSHLSGFLPEVNVVIKNGIPNPVARWHSKDKKRPMHFLFVGRLTRVKGLQVVLSALSAERDGAWILDIVGDGPQRRELEDLAENLGLHGKVRFHGFRDDTDRMMASSDCLVFPSLDEGMPLTFMQAARVGIPVLASDIEPVRELVGEDAPLVAAGDERAWIKAFSALLRAKATPLTVAPSTVPTSLEMAEKTVAFLGAIVQGERGKAHENPALR